MTAGLVYRQNEEPDHEQRSEEELDAWDHSTIDPDQNVFGGEEEKNQKHDERTGPSDSESHWQRNAPERFQLFGTELSHPGKDLPDAEQIDPDHERPRPDIPLPGAHRQIAGQYVRQSGLLARDPEAREDYRPEAHREEREDFRLEVGRD